MNTILKQAMEHFEMEENEITKKHLDFIREQNYAKNYGNLGVPKRQYSVNILGIVEFTKPILTQAELSLSNN